MVVVADSRLQDGKRTSCEFVFLNARDLVLAMTTLDEWCAKQDGPDESYVSSERGFWRRSL